MTRRALLRGSVAAGLAPATAWASEADALVLDRAAAFDRAYREQSEGWRGVASARERAMRHPDCPRPPLHSRDALKRFAEHMKRQGVGQAVVRAQTLSRVAADAARAAFDVQAREPAGALAKLEIVRTVEQDPRVSRCLTDRSPGIDSVVADLRRLAGILPAA